MDSGCEKQSGSYIVAFFGCLYAGVSAVRSRYGAGFKKDPLSSRGSCDLRGRVSFYHRFMLFLI